jgi:hypothetical protein
MTGLEALAASDFVRWKVDVLAAHRRGEPPPPLPRPAYTQSPLVEQRPSDAAEFIERLIEVHLAARTIVEAVGRG